LFWQLQYLRREYHEKLLGEWRAQPGGTSIHYAFNGNVSNTGVGTLNHATVVDSPSFRRFHYRVQSGDAGRTPRGTWRRHYRS